MFKRIKESELLLKIKELWQNPKTHDIMVLAFWLIFIVVVIIFVRGLGTSSKSVQSEVRLNDFASMKSYDFTYKTNDKEINGSYYDDALVFYLDNHRYYYKDNVYLVDEVMTITNYDLDILKIDSKMLNNLVSGITPADMGSFKQYIVPLDRFINLYEIDTQVDLSRAATLNIVVSVYFSDNEINKVILDLSNYYTLKNGKEVSYPITILYYNVNNVSNFTKGYDRKLGVK